MPGTRRLHWAVDESVLPNSIGKVAIVRDDYLDVADTNPSDVSPVGSEYGTQCLLTRRICRSTTVISCVEVFILVNTFPTGSAEQLDKIAADGVFLKVTRPSPSTEGPSVAPWDDDADALTPGRRERAVRRPTPLLFVDALDGDWVHEIIGIHSNHADHADVSRRSRTHPYAVNRHPTPRAGAMSTGRDPLGASN